MVFRWVQVLLFPLGLEIQLAGGTMWWRWVDRLPRVKKRKRRPPWRASGAFRICLPLPWASPIRTRGVPHTSSLNQHLDGSSSLLLAAWWEGLRLRLLPQGQTVPPCQLVRDLYLPKRAVLKGVAPLVRLPIRWETSVVLGASFRVWANGTMGPPGRGLRLRLRQLPVA